MSSRRHSVSFLFGFVEISVVFQSFPAFIRILHLLERWTVVCRLEDCPANLPSHRNRVPYKGLDKGKEKVCIATPRKFQEAQGGD